MKRPLLALAFCILLATVTQPLCTADQFFQYESEELGFSLTVSGISNSEISVTERESGIDLVHAPSVQDSWSGLLGSIEVVTPRERLFSGDYSNQSYQILSMGEDSVYLWKAPIGGVQAGVETLSAYRAAGEVLSFDNLRESLRVALPDQIPEINVECNYLIPENGMAQPEELLTRSELAQFLYRLLETGNEDVTRPQSFSDIDEDPAEEAITYLASYGILSGYPDGTFRPTAPVRRDEFSVVLHRFQFILSPLELYGDVPSLFFDVPMDTWAAKWIGSASIYGWMTGDENGAFYPNRAITRAEAVTALNRVLARDESHTDASRLESPFSDLSADHWAYANFLEAAGLLTWEARGLPDQAGVRLPFGADVWFWDTEEIGWAAKERALYNTKNCGETWEIVGENLPFSIINLFFKGQEGFLLGRSESGAYALLYTANGGETWQDFLKTPEIRSEYLPVEQFPREDSMIEAIKRVSLRPADHTTVYLQIWYEPYESIYLISGRTVLRQSAIQLS